MDDSLSSLRASVSALSRFFVGEESLEATLQRVVVLAHEAMDGADMVGITMLNERGRPSTTVFTDGEAPEIDRSQYRTGQGPCLEAFRTGEVMRIESTDTERRWPEFVQSAREHNVRSTVSLPLIARGESIGALNVYSRTEAAFDERAVDVGRLFAEAEDARAAGCTIDHAGTTCLSERRA